MLPLLRRTLPGASPLKYQSSLQREGLAVGWLLLGLGLFKWLQTVQPIHFLYIDEVVWMELATRGAAGQLPYSDFPWGYLPFGALVPGWWAAVFGANFASFQGFVDLISLAISLGVWGILRVLGLPALAATLGTLAMVLSSTLLVNTQLFSFNLYTPAIALASLGGTLCLLGLFGFWQSSQRPWLILGGLGMAFALLCKHEAAAGSLVTAIVFTLGHGWYYRQRGQREWWDLVTFWGWGLAPVVLVYGWLLIQLGPAVVLPGIQGNGGASQVLSSNPGQSLQFILAQVTGAWGTRWAEIQRSQPWLLLAISLVGLIYVQLWRDKAAPKFWWTGITAALLGCGGLGLLQGALQFRGRGLLQGLAAQQFLDQANSLAWSGKWLPLLYLGLVVALLPRYRRWSPQTQTLTSCLALLSIYNLFNYFRTFLEADPALIPTFSVFMPLSLLLWILVLYQVSQLLPWPAARSLTFLTSLTTMLAILLVAFSGSLLAQEPTFRLQTSQGDVTVPLTVGPTIQAAIAYVETATQPGQRVLSCPYTNLNYLAQRPIVFTSIFCFDRISDRNAQFQMERIQADPPVLLAIADYPALQFDWQSYTQKYFPELAPYLAEHYTFVRRIGNQHLAYDFYQLRQP